MSDLGLDPELDLSQRWSRDFGAALIGASPLPSPYYISGPHPNSLALNAPRSMLQPYPDASCCAADPYLTLAPAFLVLLSLTSPRPPLCTGARQD